MIWRIVRSPECSSDVLHAGWATAQAVCAAVEHFAREGSRSLEPAGGDSTLFRLTAPGGFAIVHINEATKTIFVLRIHADKPLPRRTSLLDDVATFMDESED